MDYKRLQEVTRGDRRLQLITRGYMVLQEVTRDYKGFKGGQWVQGVTRG